MKNEIPCAGLQNAIKPETKDCSMINTSRKEDYLKKENIIKIREMPEPEVQLPGIQEEKVYV